MIGSAIPAAQVQLAPGNSADLDDVMKVMNSAFHERYGEAWTRSQCAGILPMSGVSLTLARDADAGRSLGFALSRTVADEAELLLLAVLPDYQRRGIASRLLDQFILFAQEDQAVRIHLEVRDGNPAVEMYQAAGFEVAGRRRDYYQGCNGERFDALTLARDL